MTAIDLGTLGLDRGGSLLVEHALVGKRPGHHLQVLCKDPALSVHLPVWAREHGHTLVFTCGGPVVIRGDTSERRWADAVRAGDPASVVDQAEASWGLAARGALVESGGVPLAGASLDRKDQVWTELAPKLYAQAAANQWDPATAIDWTPPVLPGAVEDAVVQVMTYLVENEQAAFLVPARFIGRIHPHYREVTAFLATQIADEARHAHVFARRIELCGRSAGLSAVGGRQSLQTLLDESDWNNASFLLSVLGEGSFLSLLSFLERHAPDPVTSRIVHLALTDEARHVAFAIGHLEEHIATDQRRRDRLRAAIEFRHDSLVNTGGLSRAVRDSLVLLAAGTWSPEAIQAGWEAVQGLRSDMDQGRQRRLLRLGFTDKEATELSALHTENFM